MPGRPYSGSTRPAGAQTGVEIAAALGGDRRHLGELVLRDDLGASAGPPGPPEEQACGRGGIDLSLFGEPGQFALGRIAELGADVAHVLDAADADGNDSVSALVDALYLLNWEFNAGDEPPAPGTDDCGVDPDDETKSAVGCEASPECDSTPRPTNRPRP